MDVLARLPKVVRVLIDLGHNVGARTPPRTYPLYTLIECAFRCRDFCFSDDFCTCLKLLLDDGADPNFDEVSKTILSK